MTRGPPPRARRVSLRSPRAFAMTKTPRTVGRRLRIRRRRRRRRSRRSRRRRRGSRRRGPPTLACVYRSASFTHAHTARPYIIIDPGQPPAAPPHPARHGHIAAAAAYHSVRFPRRPLTVCCNYFTILLPIVPAYILHDTAHTNHVYISHTPTAVVVPAAVGMSTTTRTTYMLCIICISRYYL